MSPNDCLARFAAALKDGDELEALDAWVDLRAWLNRGGFEPAWSEEWPRARFFAWQP